LTQKVITEGIITFSHCESFQACLSLVSLLRCCPESNCTYCSTIISKGLPGMSSPYHNTFDNSNITFSYAI